jgi:hypothetical protein
MLFKKKKQTAEPAATSKSQSAPAEWDLRTMMQQLRELAPVLATRDIELPLLQARLADHYRDLNRAPVPPAHFDHLVHNLDAEAWRRLALAVGALDHADIRSAMLHRPTSVAEQVEVGFIDMARNTDALTLALLRQSDVRIEEFARHFARHLGIAWRGETRDQSQRRLDLIDYKRLLAEADAAKKLAEERMDYLRKKQEQEDAAARRFRRGKQ